MWKKYFVTIFGAFTHWLTLVCEKRKIRWDYLLFAICLLFIKYFGSDWTHLTKNQNILINRFTKSPFTSKEGLCSALKDFHWFYEEGKSEAYFPRCFNVFNPDEFVEFTENFRTTSCISLLRWLVETFEEKGSFSMISDDGRVPLSCVQFATNRCKDYVECCLHHDIDVEGDIKIWEHDWDV